jgi:Fic family protein
MISKLETFLIESNAIEDVWDDGSYLKANRAYHSLDKCTHLTPWYIKQVHSVLMDGKLEKPELGEWRKCAVYIGGREGRPWYAIPELIDNWCETVQHYKTAKDIQHAHVEFERIHPFVDGNGRVGRILWAWLRVKNGLPMKVIWEKKKWEYYKWFTWCKFFYCK